MCRRRHTTVGGLFLARKCEIFDVRALDIYPFSFEENRAMNIAPSSKERERGNNGESSNEERESVLDKACRSVGRWTAKKAEGEGKKR